MGLIHWACSKSHNSLELKAQIHVISLTKIKLILMIKEHGFEAIRKVVKESINSLKENKLPNPFYGKELLFFEGCIGPRVNRTQLMGYLGAFSGGNKELTTKIDYAIIPKSVYTNLLKSEFHETLKKIEDCVHVKSKKTNNYRNTIPDTKIIPEDMWIEIVGNFSQNDSVKMNQYTQLNVDSLHD